MFMKNYLSSIILFFSVCFAQNSSMNSSSDLYYTYTASELTDVTSTVTDATSAVTDVTSIVTDATSAVTDVTSIVTDATSAVTDVTSIVTDATSEAAGVISTVTDATSEATGVISAVTNATSEATGVTSIVTSTTSATTNATSAATSITSAVTNAPIATNINVTFTYRIQSDFDLKLGVINDTNATQNVEALVDDSLNSTGFNKTVLRSEIQIGAKAATLYNLLVYILLTINRIGCDTTCIQNATSAPKRNISLPLSNGTLMEVYPVSAQPQVTVTTTTTTQVTVTTATPGATSTYSKGGSSPGIPAQLGMGLGISLIGVLLIVEIVFLWRKYGLSNPSRREQYGMTSSSY